MKLNMNEVITYLDYDSLPYLNAIKKIISNSNLEGFPIYTNKKCSYPTCLIDKRSITYQVDMDYLSGSLEFKPDGASGVKCSYYASAGNILDLADLYCLKKDLKSESNKITPKTNPPNKVTPPQRQEKLKEIINDFEGTAQEWYESIGCPKKSNLKEWLQEKNGVIFGQGLDDLLRSTELIFKFKIGEGRPPKNT